MHIINRVASGTVSIDNTDVNDSYTMTDKITNSYSSSLIELSLKATATTCTVHVIHLSASCMAHVKIDAASSQVPDACIFCKITPVLIGFRGKSVTKLHTYRTTALSLIHI